MKRRASGLFHLRKPPRIRKPPLVGVRSGTRGGFLKCTPAAGQKILGFWASKWWEIFVFPIEIDNLASETPKIFRLRRAKALKHFYLLIWMIPKLDQILQLRKPPLVGVRSVTRGGFLKWNSPDRFENSYELQSAKTNIFGTFHSCSARSWPPFFARVPIFKKFVLRAPERFLLRNFFKTKFKVSSL